MPSSVRHPVRSAVAGVVERAAVLRTDDRPVFVGGCPRSGTTLLRSMLNAHPVLALPRETHFVVESYRRRATFGDLRDPDSRRRLAEWIVTRKRTQFDRLELPRDKAISALSNAPPTVGSVVGTALKLFAERFDKPRWGDKRPRYVQELPAILDMFPDAQFVAIVRDPRSVVASIKKLGWLDSWYDGTVAGAVDRWLYSVRAGRQALRRHRDDQFLEIRYEDLVDDPASVLRHMCTFLGLSHDGLDAMLQFHRGDTDIPTPQRSRYHPKLMQPVTDAALQSWNSVLTLEEVAFIEQTTSREMAHYGYERRRNGVAIPDELFDSYANFRQRWKALPGLGRQRAHDDHPVAARLTTAQIRRHAVLRRLGLER
jgi:LPS sulfotransferase NodH